MQTVRRIYLYTITFVSLEVVLWGVIGLARSIVSSGRIGSNASALAGALSLILVGVPVFLLHWGLAQRSALRDMDERTSLVRVIFLYGTLLATLVPVVHSALILLNRWLLSAFHINPLYALLGGGQTASDNLIAMLGNALVAAYLYSVLRLDWRRAPGKESFTDLRRLYRFIWLVYSLAMVAFGISQVVQFILTDWQTVGSGSQALLANGLALLIIGAPLWVFVDRVINRSLADPVEKSSTLRLVVLTLLVFVAAGAALVSASLALSTVLRTLFQSVSGSGFGIKDFSTQIAKPLSALLPAVAIWLYYGRQLNAEMSGTSGAQRDSAQAETPSPAITLPEPNRLALRRVYLYGLSLFGLVAVSIGLLQLLGFLAYQVYGTIPLGTPSLNSQLAQALANLLVGLPLWLRAWQPMQVEAAREDEIGDHARRSILRKGYLFLILFAGVIGIMVSAGALLYQLLRALLGETPQDLLLQSLLQLRLLLVFAILLAYHWRVLRADGRMAERTLARLHAAFPVLILAPDEGNFAEPILQALQRLAPEMPVAVHTYSQGAPDESLSAARAAILPAGLLAHPPEAMRLWLQSYSGARLVVPTATDGWHWVSGSGRSPSSLARQVAQAARYLAEDEAIPTPRETSPILILAYVLVGLFALQILIALISMGFSFIMD